MQNFSKAEWEDWMEHPVTEEFFRRIREEREEAIKNLANGLFAEAAGRQNIYVGLIAGLTKILEAEYSEE